MEEIRIDCANLTKEETDFAIKESQTLFKFNQTMPYTKEYDDYLNELFPNKMQNARIAAPLQGVRFCNVKIGENVIIMSNCLMMAAGGITIEDNTMIAANVQLISNNHDVEHRSIITCKPVHIKKNCWIGAGATILAGVTIGENSIVGAGSIVTKNVPDNVVVAGNPAKIIKNL